MYESIRYALNRRTAYDIFKQTKNKQTCFTKVLTWNIKLCYKGKVPFQYLHFINTYYKTVFKRICTLKILCKRLVKVGKKEEPELKTEEDNSSFFVLKRLDFCVRMYVLM